ncbi:hypothetical protein KJ365_00450 [Glaciecola sp. XM2]|jgi:hypothetical protein|uniref:hypothetical protein n=1 Tax=Glaciecola sp. XM2 TaxID=1914931 RepID=UPI001BDF03D1|nr:hypothetical protein [Glaciecola sp. XM2]MBT1449335.1 hypothetical protein [Glaciecola sp. XM2]
MKNKFMQVLCSAVLLGLSFTSSAALVLQGGTGTTGVGNIDLVSGTVVDVANGAYFSGATSPASGWVWAENADQFDDLQFTFTFDLTGYDAATADLSGLWGIDNVGTVALNGTVLSSLPDVITANFNYLTAFSADSTSGLFLAGVNVLSFDVGNRGGPGGFRASVEVNAQAVSEPSVLVLLGLSFLAIRRLSRK